jgi:hypothetical protein
MNTMPAMTGDTENGDQSGYQQFLPLKLNLVIVHAAVTPKTRFSGTAIAAAIRVSLTEANVSGSTRASDRSPCLFQGWSHTAASGTIRTSQKNHCNDNQCPAHIGGFTDAAVNCFDDGQLGWHIVKHRNLFVLLKSGTSELAKLR